MTNVFKVGGRKTHHGGGGGGSSSALASLTINNYGGSTLTNPEVRFAHVFGATDVPSGSTVALDVGGTPVPATFARRSTGLNGELRCVDILAKLPVSITASGSATVNLSAVASSTFDDTLPGGKTVANVVTDITTNHDTIGVTLLGLINSAGSTEGSGTWAADSTTAFGLTSTHGGYRCTATGPTAADFTVWMKLKDGATEHANLWAQWYITAFLDTSGNVTGLCWRVWVNQGRRDVANDKYRYQGQLKLGSTVVRSWGLTTDNRAQTFAPSAVSTSTGYITITGHGFITSDLARLSTTGTIPTGWSTTTDYWINVVDANTVYLCAAQDSAIQNGSAYIPSNQGTGTHTITGYVHHLMLQRQCWADTTGLWDWHSGITGALATRPTWHVVHDKVYCRKTLMCPPLDFSYDFAATTEAAPSKYAPGTFGRLNPAYDTGGGNISYGAPWNEWAARAYRYRNDRTGYVQTARVHALLKGMTCCHYVRDDTTFRIPVVNNGSDGAGTAYPGLGTPLPTSFSYRMSGNAYHSTDFIEPTSADTNSFTRYDYTHHYCGQYGVYVFEGGQDLLDLQYSDASGAIVSKDGSEDYTGTSGSLSLDRKFIDGTNIFYSVCPGGEPRMDAWKINLMADVAVIGADADPETAYLRDVLRDTLGAINSCINTWGDASWRVCGGWSTSETQRGGINVRFVANEECQTQFEQDYILMAWAFAYLRRPSTNLQAAVDLMCTQMGNLWANCNCRAFGNTYNLKVKEAPGLSTSPDSTKFSTMANYGILDSDIDCIVWQTDGTVYSCLNGGYQYITLQAGDRIYLSDTFDVALGHTNGVPPEFALYYWYYVRQPSGNLYKLATTNSDSTIIGSVTVAQSSSTLNGAITSGQTTITTNAALTLTSGVPLLRIGSELLRVTGGSGTTTLTVTRGAYGTTAASASSGDTVSVLWTSLYWSDVHMRTTGCPTTIYRHYTEPGGSAGAAQFGYLTMARAALGYAYLAGRLSIDGYNNADAFFQQESNTAPSTTGPQSFIDQNSIMHTVVTSV